MVVAIGTFENVTKVSMENRRNPHLMHSKSVPAYPSFTISTFARILPTFLHSELGTD